MFTSRSAPLRTALVAFCGALFALGVLFSSASRNAVVAQSAQKSHRAQLDLDRPDRACARCHQAIYERYERSAMARASGLAVDGLIPGGFTHAASGVSYRLFLRDGQAWLQYDRASIKPDAALHGEQPLAYYIGSGKRGRTYLFQQDGLWFEAPVNYYSKKQVWDMPPAYGAATTMPFTLPVDSNCLHCHAGQVQTPLPEARNRYAGAPFHAGGVGCASCHGDPGAHIAQHGNGPIINPAKLPPVRRDSICLQCHLEGDAAIYRAGRSLASYQPGEDLSDDVVYFVNTARDGFGNRASSQYEALLRSACKRGSGDRLTCTTCHDAHGSPPAEQRVSFYRAKCLNCHSGAAMEHHHPEQPACAVCHMPTRNSDDISHEQLTDHDIEARPHLPALASLDRSVNRSANMVPVGGVAAGDRETGLAYAQLAKFGDESSGEKALHLLLKAEKNGAADAEVHLQAGFLEQISGNNARARDEYLATLAQDPYEPTAATNLAVLDASRGNVSDSLRLLKRVVDADPSQTAAGLNLAFIQCSLGATTEAQQTLTLLRRFNPDSAPLRQFAVTGRYGGRKCDLHPDSPSK